MDLAFCSYHENSQNHWIPFLEDEIWAVVPNGHPLADCEELSWPSWPANPSSWKTGPMTTTSPG